MKKIGIIYSPGFGAGWSSWGDAVSSLDQELALAIDGGDREAIEKIAAKNWPGQYTGGLRHACVEWVDEGTLFRIDEYDGNESIEYNYNVEWQVAK